MDKKFMEDLKAYLMMEGKVLVKDDNIDDVKEFLDKKDIPFKEYPLMPDKTLIELDIKKIVEQLFGDE
jgi:hypothetical protein